MQERQSVKSMGQINKWIKSWIFNTSIASCHILVLAKCRWTWGVLKWQMILLFADESDEWGHLSPLPERWSNHNGVLSWVDPLPSFMTKFQEQGMWCHPAFQAAKLWSKCAWACLYKISARCRISEVDSQWQLGCSILIPQAWDNPSGHLILLWSGESTYMANISRK